LSIDSRGLRDAFGRFATGVTIVTGLKPDGEPVGVTANSFTSVSLAPPLLLWCLQNDSTSFEAFTLGRPFTVNVLRADQDRQAMHFARRQNVKFPLGRATTQSGRPPRIDGAICRIDCEVVAQHAAGDHTIIVGSVLGIEIADGPPLLYHNGAFGDLTRRASAQRIESWETFGGDWF
jgi:flavin reductase (DIM6/NTAB) family NADH-FMN oxidoreductase RutF